MNIYSLNHEIFLILIHLVLARHSQIELYSNSCLNTDNEFFYCNHSVFKHFIVEDLQDVEQFYSFSFFKDSNFFLSFSMSFSNRFITSSIGKLLKVWIFPVLVFTPQFS